MAIVIPIISEFNSKGVKSATQAFNNLERSAAKVGNAMKTAFLGAAAAIGSVAFAGYKFAQAAMEDEQSAALLARQIHASTKATDAQVKATEKFIAKTSLAVGVVDDKLRPAYANILRGAKDLTKAQQGLSLALDISAATGKPLEAVSTALGRAYAGNFTALSRLSPEVKNLIKHHANLNTVLNTLSRTYNGAAATAADTTAGRMARLKVAFQEAQESIGYLLLPAVNKLVDFFNTSVLPTAQKITDAFKEYGLKGAIKEAGKEFDKLVGKATGWKAVMLDLAGAVAAVGLAFKTWSIVNSIIAGINGLTSALSTVFPAIAGAGLGAMATTLGLVAANLVLIVDSFRNLESRKDVFTLFAGGFRLVEDAVISVYKAIRFMVNHFIDLVNAINPFSKLAKLPDVKYANIPFLDNGAPTVGKPAPQVASGAVAARTGSTTSTYNINVRVDPTTDRASVGRNIVEAINAYQRRTGVVVPATR